MTRSTLRYLRANGGLSSRKQISNKTALARAAEKAAISDFRFHDLRHTFSTNMRRAGVEEVVTMKLTGHRTMSMYCRYSTVDLDDAREAMAKFESYLGRESRTTAISTAVK
ncbi:MAG: tyrosine-type recombinase/integrase [Syntrophobacter sp.]